ncbi:bifunctional (p)ppGpp synthetase/guanosine-3',5'-bis(diphosphate) 3'-pyrophosphohydrolase [Thermovirga sp.]|uniref:RelA/SpoT family protein n=1 Tax=Thermovirga sp. TaxID=2699834 RepID=UPI0025E8F82D|nr:bifunctional (p)ppGpp synthetase/guanosine-3',5'-bis(diphosphate) 3'-pyrophosphohydrolase [Thermovirga sp.]MBO8154158.1 bifunctional (p)ppGpp synthetase/guanosine-3',5'-bis(diphosphate) 3'-pyrophosphohydrolase [Thermovirga sp.]
MKKATEMQATQKKKSMRLLRDSFVGRLPKDQRDMSVKMAWQEFWAKASSYLPKEDLIRCGEAFVFAATAHDGQFRLSKEPYVVHPVRVAAILADMELDVSTLKAAFLHDVLEDTSVPPEEIATLFGEDVFLLVDGVTKLGKITFKSFEDYQAENLRKMFLVMAKDIRVVLIKLADRLHNIKTIQYLRTDKQVRIAKETLEIYAPLAHRLGIYQIKRELEDAAFKVADPEAYYDIRRRVKKKLPERESIIKQAMTILEGKLNEMGVKAHITGRAKHFYSIYEKMRRKNVSLEELFDLLALRVIVDDVATCYTVLGVVHTIWKPLPGQFDDYIANPKSNMYQSLHTAVIGPSGEPLEVQIRTWDMHWLAEYGVASHWRYKEGKQKLDELDQKLSWIRQALEAQAETSEPSEFLEHVKADVLSSEVFVFTPKGDVISLPLGSTPLDFAYTIHTEVGNKFIGAMVNNRIVPMDYELQNGDIVKILTSPHGKPSRDWLNIAKSNRAKSKIRSYFRQQEKNEREEKITKGKEYLTREIKKRLHKEKEEDKGVALSTSLLNKVAKDIGYSNFEELLMAIGTGEVGASQVASKYLGLETSKAAKEEVVLEAVKEEKEEAKTYDAEIVVQGIQGLLVGRANCCKPLPGDRIVGVVTKRRGVIVHKDDCPNISKIPRDRLVEVEWGSRRSERYSTRLRIDGTDRPGLFADVAHTINTCDGTILQVRASVTGTGRARMVVDLKVKDIEHLYQIIAKINVVKGVIEVIRG